jgi:hypothetical protein
MKYWAIDLSFGIALLIAVWTWISARFTNFNTTFLPGFEILGTMWVGSVILAIAIHRKRGLWTLAGLPIACWWSLPVVIGCSHAGMCM